MKIASSTLQLSSRHAYAERTQVRESLLVWRGQRPNTDTPSLSSAARRRLADDIASTAPAVPAGKPPAVAESADAVEGDPFIHLVKTMVEMLTGVKIRVFTADDLGPPPPPVPELSDPHAPVPAPARPTGFGLEYEYHSARTEIESTEFSAEGVVRTADGQEVRFRLDLSMFREYHEETHASLRLGDAVRRDPLVLNFAGTAAQLQDQRFRFDLDGDGRAEELPLLAGGSGYLALDRNANGRIDNGLELLGPATDNGFSELAALDTDGSGWIDEDDAAFHLLKVWQPDADGGGTLASLAEMNVGALALAHLATPFALRGAGNADLGAVRSSGLWLGEDGRSGSLQEIDLTV